jgi:hypothetical protein
MAKLLCRGNEVEYTILPYELDTPIEEELKNSSSDRLVGYVTHDNDTGDRKFVTLKFGYEWTLNLALSVLKRVPYGDDVGPWIIYKGSPEKAATAFNNIVGKYAQTIHIHNWDSWRLDYGDTIMAVVTSWETY